MLVQHGFFTLYSLFVAPLIIAALFQGEVDAYGRVGWVLLGALLLEIPALHILLLDIASRLKSESGGESDESSGLLFAAWLAHLLVVIIMYMQALRALGLEEQVFAGGWPMWFIPLWIIKEISVLMALWNDEGREFGAGATTLAQVVLFVFSCLVHTAFWGLMMHDPDFSGYSTVLLVMSTLIFGFFFTIFYAAVQLPALRYNAAAEHGTLRRNWLIGLMLAGFAAIWPFLSVEFEGRYTSLEAASADPAGARLLALQQSRLTAFPEEVTRLAGLRKLYLFENKIPSVPPKIGRLNRLEHLSLGYNQIAELPPEFGELRRLKTLNIYVNRLTALPPEIGNLEALEELNAGWNRLRTLPPEIGKLKNLRELKLSRNRIVALPPEIGQLKALRKLDLSQNGLRDLPESFYRLELDELELGKNPLDARVRARLKKELPDTKIAF